MICDETAPLSLHRPAPIPEAAPAQAFDDLTVLAAQICGTPIALMTLVDENRHRVEMCVGIDATVASRDSAFRAHTIQQDSLFVVADALDDDRFREHPLVVGEPRLRFYAGASLVTHDGHAVGTLCVIDRVPTLVVCGTEDQVTPAAEMKQIADAIPGARFVPIAAAGHLSHVEAPGPFLDAVTSFLETAVEARPS